MSPPADRSRRPRYVMPVQPELYDRSPLSSKELQALAALIEGGYHPNSSAARVALQALERLWRPLHHVFALRNRGGDVSGRSRGGPDPLS